MSSKIARIIPKRGNVKQSIKKHYSGRSCDILIAKTPIVGNNVSHSNRKTKRLYNVNIHKTTFYSDTLRINYKLNASTTAKRTFMKYNASFDDMLLNLKRAKLTSPLKKIREKIYKIKNIQNKKQ